MDKMLMVMQECMKELGISYPTLLKLVNTDGFPAFRIGDKWVISRAGLEEWVATNAKDKSTIDIDA